MPKARQRGGKGAMKEREEVSSGVEEKHTFKSEPTAAIPRKKSFGVG